MTHELTHAFIEAYSGKAYLNVKYLDEGLADYFAWRICSGNPLYANITEAERAARWSTFQQMVTGNSLYQLNQITTDAQWSNLYGNQATQTYAEGFIVTAYLMDTYGPSRVLPILKAVQTGTSASNAVQTALGISESQIIDAVRTAPESTIFTPEPETLAITTQNPTTLGITKGIGSSEITTSAYFTTSSSELRQSTEIFPGGGFTTLIITSLAAIVIITLAGSVLRSRNHGYKKQVGSHPRDEAVQLLRKRYASGEISADEYNKILKHLQADTDS